MYFVTVSVKLNLKLAGWYCRYIQKAWSWGCMKMLDVTRVLDSRVHWITTSLTPKHSPTGASICWSSTDATPTCRITTTVRHAQITVKPNTHRRRDSTRQLSLVGVGGVYWDSVDLHGIAAYIANDLIEDFCHFCVLDITSVWHTNSNPTAKIRRLHRRTVTDRLPNRPNQIKNNQDQGQDWPRLVLS